MGAGASAVAEFKIDKDGIQLPDSKIDKDAAQAAAGDHFDEAVFDAAAVDGCVTKEQFLAALKSPSSQEDGSTASTAASTQELALKEPVPKPSGNPLPTLGFLKRLSLLLKKDFKQAEMAAKAAQRDAARVEKLRSMIEKEVAPSLPKKQREAKIAADPALKSHYDEFKALTKCAKKQKGVRGSSSYSAASCGCTTCRLPRCERELYQAEESFRDVQQKLQEVRAIQATADLNAILQSGDLSQRWESDVGEVLKATVGALTSSDFPMRLVFLDKSGSMHSNRNVLNYTYSRAATPKTGSTLTFMLAGPGETQFMFSRVGAAATAEGSLRLGSATWFNEPVIRTLASLAPAVEQLIDDAKKAGQSLRIDNDAAEPPLQVLCLTDGMDNCSPCEIGDLFGVVAAIRGLVGPSTGRSIYEPLSPISRSAPIGTDGVDRVPVWLMWVAVGCGGRQFMEDAVPGAVTLVDATSITTTDVPLDRTKVERWEIPVPDLDAADSVKPGHYVSVAQLSEGDEDDPLASGTRNAIVLEDVDVEADLERQVVVLYSSGGTEEVLVSRCTRVIPPAPPRVQSKTVGTAGQVQDLLNAAFMDQRSLARAAVQNRDGSKVVPALAPVAPADPDEPVIAPSIEEVKFEPLPPDYVVSMMRTLGDASRSLSAEDRVKAQRIAASVLSEIMGSRTVFTGHFAQNYAPPLGFHRLPNHRICGPALALLKQLAALGVLKTAEKPLRCKCCEEEVQTAYTAWDPCVPALAVALRLLQLRESRCVHYVPEGGDSRPATPEVLEAAEGPAAWPAAPEDGLPLEDTTD